MAAVTLIKLEGKPIEKLIDVISKGIGTIYKPTAMRKEAESEAYKIEIIERAKSKAIAEGKEIEAESLIRIEQRFLFKEQEKQKNIDVVTRIAAEQLSQLPSVSSDKVDEYWTRRFFNIVEDISDDEMQQLWGRILAGEVKQPKSFSLRTLELLKNITKEEANVFIKFAKAKIVAEDIAFILSNQDDKFLEHEFEITFLERLLLTELGLLRGETNLNFSLTANQNEKTVEIFQYGKTGIQFNRMENSPQQEVQIIVFTSSGKELSQLIEQDKININYLEKICACYKHPSVLIEYGDLTTNEKGELEVVNKTPYTK